MYIFFGGSFDPIHNGHLRIATELSEAFSGAPVHLLPCHIPPHKDGLNVGVDTRATMLQLACANSSSLVLDDRELVREGSSYTVDTLRELLAEVEGPIIMALGTDAALGLSSWRESEELYKLCHVVVMKRPDYLEDRLEGGLERCGFEGVQSVDDLEAIRAGKFLMLNVTQLDISSSDIRRKIAQNKSIHYLVPDAVAEFICDNGHYSS